MSDPGASLASLLSVAAQRNPNGPAVRDQGKTTSWSEALTRSGQMAAALLNAGVQPGDRVGVLYRKCVDSFLAMHAVVQQGAVAVPLDPTASASYLASVVDQSGCRVILSHPPCQSTLSSLTAVTLKDAALKDIVQIDTVTDPAMLGELTPLAPRDVDPDSPAYIITTSGSTGRPKGICHSHRSAMAYVRFKLAAYDLKPSDRISDIAPNHFDISTLALWVTPFVGATNIVIAEQYQMLPASLSALMTSEQISVWYSVPYLLTQLLSRGGLDRVDLQKMRWVLFGGEVFPPLVLADLMAVIPHARFSNVYGPAEVNACAIHHLPGPPDGDSPIPIGQPVSDTQIRLVQTEPGSLGQPVAPGDQGEIWVRASTMMLGYWQQPDLTKLSIVTDPATGESWYRTGDLGWRKANGDLVFAGRLDHQVKVRGYRVELEAIESILEDFPLVENAVATVTRTAQGSDQIIAGILHQTESDFDLGALTSHAQHHLPTYAVPSALYLLHDTTRVRTTLSHTTLSHTTPNGSRLTGSGKLDRRDLRTNLLRQHETEQEQSKRSQTKKDPTHG